MRKILKFAHTLGAVGLLGAMAALLVAQVELRTIASTADVHSIVILMDHVARWILLPSLGVTLVSGLLGMAVVPAYHGAGWVWAKLATGVLTFEGGLMAIQGPVQKLAEEAAASAAAGVVVTVAPAQIDALQGSLATLMAVAIVNIALGIWRPRKRNPAT